MYLMIDSKLPKTFKHVYHKDNYLVIREACLESFLELLQKLNCPEYDSLSKAYKNKYAKIGIELFLDKASVQFSDPADFFNAFKLASIEKIEQLGKEKGLDVLRAYKPFLKIKDNKCFICVNEVSEKDMKILLILFDQIDCLMAYDEQKKQLLVLTKEHLEVFNKKPFMYKKEEKNKVVMEEITLPESLKLFAELDTNNLEDQKAFEMDAIKKLEEQNIEESFLKQQLDFLLKEIVSYFIKKEDLSFVEQIEESLMKLSIDNPLLIKLKQLCLEKNKENTLQKN